MTIQTTFNDIIKISETELETCQSVLTKSGYSLDEILDYDDGRSYQQWSNDNSTRVILDVIPKEADNSERIITEIFDCWLELRAIRNALEDEAELPSTTLYQEISAFDQLMGNIREFEAELHEDEAIYKLMIKGEIDTSLVSYYNLDEETRQAVLQ